MNLTNFKLNK